MAGYLWLAVVVLMAILEGATVSLVSVWFAGGALAAMIAAFCGGPLWLQVVLFVSVSGILLACLRPLAKRLAKPGKTRLNADRILGQIAVVTEEISNDYGKGAAKIGGIEWTARSDRNEVIPVGTKVTILRIEGVKIFVEPLKEKATV